jgi:hypothetical protein
MRLGALIANFCACWQVVANPDGMSFAKDNTKPIGKPVWQCSLPCAQHCTAALTYCTFSKPVAV